jgi:hypothetical protein
MNAFTRITPMSHYVPQEPELDVFAYLVRYRQIVSQLSASCSSSLTLPLNGADPVAVTAALELAPCLRLPRDVVTMFCAVGLGHRLIPVARQDIPGLTRWPTIDAHLTDADLQDVAGSDHRREIAHLLQIWASIVEKPFGCDADGWIGGRVVRGERGQARMLWPTLYPAFSSNAYAEFFDLFGAFDIPVGTEA